MLKSSPEMRVEPLMAEEALRQLLAPGRRAAQFLEIVRGFGGRYAPRDFLSKIADDEWFVLAFDGDDGPLATFVFAVTDYPQKRVLSILGGAGEQGRLREWMPRARPAFSDIAQRVGAQWLEAYGRPGWKKLFPDTVTQRTYYLAEV